MQINSLPYPSIPLASHKSIPHPIKSTFPADTVSLHFGKVEKNKPPKPLEQFVLLRPMASHPWESKNVSNPAVTRLPNNNILMLYRADSSHTPGTAIGISPYVNDNPKTPKNYARIGLAILDPAGSKLISRNENPTLAPLTKELQKYPNGFEDPRITKIDNSYYITVSAINLDDLVESRRAAAGDLSKPIKGSSLYLIKTDDFKSFDYIGKVGPDSFNKNSFFLPEKVNIAGTPHFVFFHRLKTDIQTTLVKDIHTLKKDEFWEQEIKNRDKNTLVRAQFLWEGFRTDRPEWPGQVSGAAPPIKIQVDSNERKLITFNSSLPLWSKPKKPEEAWLFVYNAAGGLNERGAPIGRQIGACILAVDKNGNNLENPIKVIARAPYPILKPNLPEDCDGPNGADIIFSCGYLPSPDNKNLDIFYGSGDRNVSKARFNMEELCNYVLKFNANGEPVA